MGTAWGSNEIKAIYYDKAEYNAKQAILDAYYKWQKDAEEQARPKTPEEDWFEGLK
jgi:hypothetical protein